MLYVDVHDLLPLFSEREGAALAEYQAFIRSRAAQLSLEGDVEGAKALRESIAPASRAEGTITADEEGIRVSGAEAAGWLARKLRTATPEKD